MQANKLMLTKKTYLWQMQQIKVTFSLYWFVFFEISNQNHAFTATAWENQLLRMQYWGQFVLLISDTVGAVCAFRLSLYLSIPPASEMTYIVSGGALNSTQPFLSSQEFRNVVEICWSCLNSLAMAVVTDWQCESWLVWQLCRENFATVISFITGNSNTASDSVMSAPTPGLRHVTTDNMPMYSCTTQQQQHSSGNNSQYPSRRPLTSHNGPQMLPARQLAQHSMDVFISRLVSRFSCSSYSLCYVSFL